MPCSLGPITCVTVTAPDLNQVESCYTTFFEYRVVSRARLSRSLANLWACPALAGHATLTLAPAAGTECVFRFIETRVCADYVPFSTYGWNAAEVMVQNVDALAERIQGSDFEIIGEPANLSFSDDIRAMQVLGPGQELLYLTEFNKQLPGLDVPAARCAVDRVFIVIVGGASMSALQDFYFQRFGVTRAKPVASRVKGMSAAFGNSPEQKYPIAALPLKGKTLIEVDEMPTAASLRPVPEDSLPAGIAMVSFAGDRSDRPDWSGPPAMEESTAPYAAQARINIVSGAAGEIIEVVHAG